MFDRVLNDKVHAGTDIDAQKGRHCLDHVGSELSVDCEDSRRLLSKGGVLFGDDFPRDRLESSFGVALLYIMSLRPCLVIDIDDTLYVHNSKLLQYHKIKPDNHLKAQFQRIQHPKFILTNATYGHANIILNKMDVEDEFIKIYSRDSIPRMKPSFDCYQSVQTDICNELQRSQNQYIFFDDLLENLEGAHHMNWKSNAVFRCSNCYDL